jgi:hypothetical protein
MSTQAEIDAWKERMKAIKTRLSRPHGLTHHEFGSLNAELIKIEQLLRKAVRS